MDRIVWHRDHCLLFILARQWTETNATVDEAYLLILVGFPAQLNQIATRIDDKIPACPRACSLAVPEACRPSEGKE